MHCTIARQKLLHCTKAPWPLAPDYPDALPKASLGRSSASGQKQTATQLHPSLERLARVGPCLSAYLFPGGAPDLSAVHAAPFRFPL